MPQGVSFTYEYTDAHGVSRREGGFMANAPEVTTERDVRDFLKSHKRKLQNIPDDKLIVTIESGGMTPEAQRTLAMAMRTNVTLRSSQ